MTADGEILQREWTYPTHGTFDAGERGSEFSNPVLADNTLIFGNQTVGLVALYPGMVRTRWVLPIHGGVVSELQVERGAVFFGGGDGFLYSVNIENGRVNWRYDLRNAQISRPTLDNGKIYVTTSDDTVYAFESGTGKWLWHYRRRTAPLATIHGASAPLVDGGEVLAGLSDGFLVSLAIGDGQLKWERKLHNGTKFTDVDAHPVLDRGVLYIPSYDGALYALKRQGGEIIWRFDAGGSKRAVVDGERIYLPSSDGNLYALDRNNAKVLWKFPLDHGTPTQIVMTDRHIIMGSSHQYVYVLDKDDGQGIYRFNAGYDSGFYGTPEYDTASHRLYMLSTNGNLYAFTFKAEVPRREFLHAVTTP